ncbi:MAG: GSU2204 family CXXCH-containing (seleno)protein [Acidobacteriota bacterium]|nr:GSU2204 family CXXCH-containing (seleno)protein [Acidobacteriota bacterium]
MMSKRISLILLATLAGIGVLPCAAGESGVGEVAVGVRSVNTDDSLNRAAEFESTSSSAVVAGWWSTAFGETSNMALDLLYLDSGEQDYGLVLDFSPSLRLEADHTVFEHHLPHDPLANLEGWDGEGKIVQHTDLDAGNLYREEFNQAHAALIWRPKNSPAWELALKTRSVWREGTRQHRSTDHCYSCHIVGQGVGIDEQLDDLTLEAGYLRSNWGVKYSYTQREYSDDSADDTRWFDPAHHPSKVTPSGAPLPVFGNRVQFGVLPDGTPAWYEGAVAVSTEFERDSHVLTAFWNGNRDHLDGAVAKYTVSSKANLNRGGVGTGYDLDYTSAMARWVHRSGERTKVRIRGRYEKIDSDDAAITLTENVALAGPQAGDTYADVYGADNVDGNLGPDELRWNPDDYRIRRSAVDRKVLTAGADLIYRLGKDRRHRLQVSLKSRTTDRENYAVNDGGSTRTTENTLALRLRGTLGEKKNRYQAAVEWYSADDPFTNVDGGCRTAGTDPADPFVFPWNSYQYYQLYALRFANLTNQPTDRLTLRASVTLSPLENSSLTLQAKRQKRTNDQTQVSDWESSSTDLGALLWWAPSPRIYTVASAQYLKEDQETHICIPLMGG